MSDESNKKESQAMRFLNQFAQKPQGDDNEGIGSNWVEHKPGISWDMDTDNTKSESVTESPGDLLDMFFAALIDQVSELERRLQVVESKLKPAVKDDIVDDDRDDRGIR